MNPLDSSTSPNNNDTAANDAATAINSLVAYLESNDLAFPEIMDMKTLLRFLPITRRSVQNLVK